MTMFRVALAGLLLSMTTTALQADEPQTITDFVAMSGGEFDADPFDYDILLNAVLTAELDQALADPEANLTLFAPNDLAFQQLAVRLGFRGFGEQAAWEFLVATLTDLGDGDPVPVLTDILLYHVVPDSVDAVEFLLAGLFQIPLPTLLTDATFLPSFIFLIDNEPDLPDPTLFFPLNVELSNGIVHTVSGVLIPIDLP